MKKMIAALVLPLALAGSLLAFDTTKTPVSPKGTRAVVDLPGDQHIRNTGGRDGQGLCVFTSGQIAARWQNMPEMEGFQAFMKTQPGGGWPEKFDNMLKAFCKQKGVPVPPYVQHTGGDPAFVEKCFKTGRAPCMTYCGVDGFYNSAVAHMVTGAHLDADEGAIIDNNEPGSWRWMTRVEWLDRWHGKANGRDYSKQMGGGWAYVFLTPPPNPRFVAADDEPMIQPNPLIEQCPDGRCPLPRRIVPEDRGWTLDTHSDGTQLFKYRDPQTGRLLYVYDAKGWHKAAGGESWFLDTVPPPAGIQAPLPTGVDTKHLAQVGVKHRYWINGVEVSREKAHAALELTDDSDRFFLSVVGDKSVVAGVQAATAKYKDRLLVQVYAPDSWPVKSGRVTAKVTLQTPRTAGGKVIGTGEDATEAGIGRVLTEAFEPPAPMPDKPPVKPAPDDKKKDKDGGCNCSGDPFNMKDCCVGGGLVALVLWLFRKAGDNKKESA